MMIREKSRMIYRMIFVRAWAENLGTESQAMRELRVQAEKLNRMCSRWDHEFLFRFDSVKKARRMQTRNDRQINPQYRRILSLVERVAQEDARQKGVGVLTGAQVRERVYGAGGLVSRADAYAKEHAIK
jgi:hypothetical protein